MEICRINATVDGINRASGKVAIVNNEVTSNRDQSSSRARFQI